MKWNDVYKGPFSRTYSKVFTVDYKMAFDFANIFLVDNPFELSDEEQDEIVNVLNDEHPPEKLYDLKYHSDDATVYHNGMCMIVIRGWGYLTGIGGLHLPDYKAKELQDEFANWIISKLQ